MAARPGGRRPALAPEDVPVELALLLAAAVAVAAVVTASRIRARRRAAELNVSGGRKSLVMNLFGQS